MQICRTLVGLKLDSGDTIKTSSKRIPTNTKGVFYKEIISKKAKLVDKVYSIRYVDENNRDRLITIGKYSEGIREAYFQAKLNEINTKIRLG